MSHPLSPDLLLGFTALALARGARPEELDDVLLILWSQPLPATPCQVIVQMDRAIVQAQTLRRRGYWLTTNLTTKRPPRTPTDVYGREEDYCRETGLD